MARVVAIIELETEAGRDAVDQLRVVYAGLASRHGERFRALERKIEALAGDDTLSAPDVHMAGGRAIAAAPVEITALLVEARALGLVK